MKNEIMLGDTVKCVHTGFEGVAVARTEFINGCVQFLVAPKVGKDNKVTDEIGIDEGSLKVIKRVEKEIEKESTGGATRTMPKLRGY